jgi:hypothetical protein
LSNSSRLTCIQKLFLLTGIVVLLRCWVASSLPMLSGEAYYWLWGQKPAAGYFNHPPMVGLSGCLFFSWIHQSELAARSAALIMGALSILSVYKFTYDLFKSDRLALRTAFWFSIIPAFTWLGTSLQPDNGLILFMIFSWWAGWNAMNSDHPPAWWALCGITGGLALMSKFMAWVLLPTIILYLLISSRNRSQLKTPWPWLAALLSMVVVFPNLAWNARHEWINYAFQIRRSGLTESHFDARNPLIFICGLLITLSPLFAFALVRSCTHHLRNWKQIDEQTRYLLCIGLPLPVFLGVLSLATKISFHWPTAGYIPLLILTVRLFDQTCLFRIKYQVWSKRVAMAMAGLFLMMPILLRVPSMLPVMDDDHPLFSLSRLHPDISGWNPLGEYIRSLYLEPDGPATNFIMTHNYYLAAKLAFYADLPHDILVFDAESEHNFRFWREQHDDLRGKDALVVIEKSNPNYKHRRFRTKYDKYLRQLNPLFESVDVLPSYQFLQDGSRQEYLGVETSPPRTREFLLFHGHGFKGHLKNEERG